MKGQTASDQKKDPLVAQEISFAKVLAGNDKKLRDRAVKKLIKWLAVRSKGKTAFTEENFHRIWSGLFYCMWMSDKFLVQEELAESISKLVHCFHNNSESALLFIKCFNKIMSLEWPGIDQHRLDKFSMLIRRFLRQSFEYCNRKDWDEGFTKELVNIFEETVLNAEVPYGFLLHFIDIFPEELSKVSKGKIKKKLVLIFLEPFIKLTATSKDSRIHNAVSLFFDYLIRQTDIGIMYEEKLRAWKELQMPSERPEDLELSVVNGSEGEDSDLEEIIEDGPLDPRAGKVDVVLHQIPIDTCGILSLIKKYQKNNRITNSGRQQLKILGAKFAKLKKGNMPENIKKPAILLNLKKKRRHTASSAKKLMEFTKKLNEDDDFDLDMECKEIDSDDDECELENISETEKKNLGGENSENPVVTKEKSKSEKRRKKKKGKENSGGKNEAKVETKTKTKSNKKCRENGKEKVKPKEIETLKPKSLKETFKIEDLDNKSNSVIASPKKKRKSLSSWEVHDLDASKDEDSKINVPKIIKLETKTNKIATEERNEDKTVEVEEWDTPVTKTRQLKLNASFWDKAKEKCFKKKKYASNIVLNPLFDDDEAKNCRRISFALDRNEVQENDEYLQEVRNSPTIPFDGARKPIQSALKSGLSPSPINPFYRFKKFH